MQANDAATATSASLLGNTTNGVGPDQPGLLETLFPLQQPGAEDLPSDVDRKHSAEALRDGGEAGAGGLVLQHHMSPNRVLQQSMSAEVAAASDKVSVLRPGRL